MAVSAPLDPPIRAGRLASPLLPDSRVLPARHPDLERRAGAQSRLVPSLVSNELPGFESKDVVTRRIEAANRLPEEDQFGKLRLLGEVAKEF